MGVHIGGCLCGKRTAYMGRMAGIEQECVSENAEGGRMADGTWHLHSPVEVDICNDDDIICQHFIPDLVVSTIDKPSGLFGAIEVSGLKS